MSNLARLMTLTTFVLLPLLFILIVFFIIYIIGRWQLFRKAGKNGWEAIIPFYNDWVYVEIAGLNYWWFFLVVANTIVNLLGDGYIESLASICSTIGLFVCNYNISKKFNRDTVFAVLMTIFPFIFIPIIGFSSNYKWDSNVSVSNNGPFGNTNNKENSRNYNDDSVKYCSYCGSRINKNDKFCNNCGREI